MMSLLEAVVSNMRIDNRGQLLKVGFKLERSVGRKRTSSLVLSFPVGERIELSTASKSRSHSKLKQMHIQRKR